MINMRYELEKDITKLQEILLSGKRIEFIDIHIQDLTNSIKFQKYSYSEIIDTIELVDIINKLIGFYWNTYSNRYVVVLSKEYYYFLGREVFGSAVSRTQYINDKIRGIDIREDIITDISVIFDTDNDYVMIDKVIDKLFYDASNNKTSKTSSKLNLSNVSKAKAKSLGFDMFEVY